MATSTDRKTLASPIHLIDHDEDETNPDFIVRGGGGVRAECAMHARMCAPRHGHLRANITAAAAGSDSIKTFQKACNFKTRIEIRQNGSCNIFKKGSNHASDL